MSVLTAFLWAIPALASFALLILLFRSQDRFADIARGGWTRILTGGVLFVIFCLVLFLLHLPVIEMLLGPWSDWVALGAYFLFATGLILVIPAAVGWLSDLAQLRTQTEKRISSVTLMEDLLALSEQPYVLTELLTAGLSTVMEYVDAKGGMVWLLAQDRITLVLAGSHGFDKPALKAAESVAASGLELFDRALRGGQVVTAGELRTRARFVATFPGLDAYGSVAVVPLSAGGDTVGMMLLAAERPYHFVPMVLRMLAGVGRVLGSAVSGQRLQRVLARLEKARAVQKRALSHWEQTLGGGVPVSVQTIMHGLLEAAGANAAFLVPRGARHIPFATDTVLTGLPLEGIWGEAVATAESRQRALWVNAGSRGSDPRSTFGRWVVIPTPAGELFFAPRSEKPVYSPVDLNRFARTAEIALRLAPAPEIPEPDRLLELALRLADEPASPQVLAEVAAELITAAEAVLVWQKAEGRLTIAGAQGCDATPLERISLPAGQGTVGRAALAVQALSMESQAELGRSWAEYSAAERAAFADAFGGLERPAAEYVVQIPPADLVLQLVRFTRGGWTPQTVNLVTALVHAYRPAPVSEAATSPLLPGAWDESANDLNNIFTGILGQAELLSQRLAEGGLPESERSGLERIINASQEGGEIVRKLGVPEPDAEVGDGLDRLAAEVLAGRHITDDLYLLPENRAVEIRTEFESTPALTSDRQRLQDVVWSALTSVAQERSALSLGTSADERFLYLAVGSPESREPLQGPFGDFFRPPDLQWKDLLPPAQLDFLRSVGAQVAADDRRQPHRLVIRIPHGPAAQPQGRPAHPGLRVLAIDDQEIIRDLLLNMFMGMGHRIQVCKSGEEGLQALASEQFDLVLTDLGMPGMSGWEVAQAVKEHNAKTPVVLITGWGFNFAEEQVRKAGVDYVLTKPFRLEHLTEIVDAAIRRSPQVH